jgi:phage terminase small subunit
MSEPIKKLSEMQRKFVDGYILHGDHKRAVIEAGYSQYEAAKTGRALLKNPLIMAELEKYKDKIQDAKKYDYEVAMQEAEETRQRALLEGNLAVAGRMVEIKSKLSGLLVDKVAVQAGFQVRIEGIEDTTKQVTEIAKQELLAPAFNSLVDDKK